jgi:hypothetical protein
VGTPTAVDYAGCDLLSPGASSSHSGFLAPHETLKGTLVRDKHGPLVIFWDLFLNSNGQPTTDLPTWHYAVNVGDPRFDYIIQ